MRDFDLGVAGADVGDDAYEQEMVQHAPRVLVRLVQGNFALQKVAGDADAVKRLANALKSEPELSPEATEAVLLALAALTEQYASLSFVPCALVCLRSSHKQPLAHSRPEETRSQLDPSEGIYTVQSSAETQIYPLRQAEARLCC